MLKKKPQPDGPRDDSLRVTFVEEDPETAGIVREALDAYKRVKFDVAIVATTKDLRDQMARRAFRDELTGLYSRVFLIELLAHEARRMRRYERDLTCIMLDLDDFQALNVVHGRKVGDAVLRRVASLIGDGVREADVVARYDEDMFCVLLLETSLDMALPVAERIRFAIAAKPAQIDGRALSLTASVGVSPISRRQDIHPEAVLERAFAALRDAKAAGKNRVSVHLPPGEEAEFAQSGQRVDLGQQADTFAES